MHLHIFFQNNKEKQIFFYSQINQQNTQVSPHTCQQHREKAPPSTAPIGGNLVDFNGVLRLLYWLVRFRTGTLRSLSYHRSLFRLPRLIWGWLRKEKRYREKSSSGKTRQRSVRSVFLRCGSIQRLRFVTNRRRLCRFRSKQRNVVRCNGVCWACYYSFLFFNVHATNICLFVHLNTQFDKNKFHISMDVIAIIFPHLI